MTEIVRDSASLALVLVERRDGVTTLHPESATQAQRVERSTRSLVGGGAQPSGARSDSSRRCAYGVPEAAVFLCAGGDLNVLRDARGARGRDWSWRRCCAEENRWCWHSLECPSPCPRGCERSRRRSGAVIWHWPATLARHCVGPRQLYTVSFAKVGLFSRHGCHPFFCRGSLWGLVVPLRCCIWLRRSRLRRRAPDPESCRVWCRMILLPKRPPHSQVVWLQLQLWSSVVSSSCSLASTAWRWNALSMKRSAGN